MQQQQHDEASQAVAWVGRYALFDELARGGMATVHLARLTFFEDGRDQEDAGQLRAQSAIFAHVLG